MHLQGQAARGERGYAMAGLLVAIAVIHLMMTMAMPTWRQFVKREKEAELVFRGEQYARAIELYQRKFAGASPPDIDTLVEQRFLRKNYKDPMTEDGEFQILRQGSVAPITAPPGQSTDRPGQLPSGAATSPASRTPQAAAPQSPAASGQATGGIIGVVSKSKDTSLMLYNGRNKYNEWVFIYMPTTAQAGAGGQPGVPGQPGIIRAAPPGAPGQPGGRGQMQPGGRGQPQRGRGQMQPGGRGQLQPGGRGFPQPPGQPAFPPPTSPTRR